MSRRAGETNAYILNLLMHSDTRYMNDYDIRERVKKRFHYHYKPNELMRFHIKPLMKRNWIRVKEEEDEVTKKNIKYYYRIGVMRRVSPLETLQDQFRNMPSELTDEELYNEYMASIDPDTLLNDEMAEKEYNEYLERENEYWAKEYEEYEQYRKEEERKKSVLKKKLSEEEKEKLKDFEI